MVGLIDKTAHEQNALDYASDMAGEHIDSLPSTDMARWTIEQWRAHLEVVVAAFTQKMGDLSKAEAPF